MCSILAPGQVCTAGRWWPRHAGRDHSQRASVTGRLSRWRRREIPIRTRRKGNKKKVTVVKATGNNLQKVTVDFPLGPVCLCDGRFGGGQIDPDD